MGQFEPVQYVVVALLTHASLVTWTFRINNFVSTKNLIPHGSVLDSCCDRCVQIIMLSASANRLSRLKEQAEEYAALIMEELDPERLGYIEVGPISF